MMTSCNSDANTALLIQPNYGCWSSRTPREGRLRLSSSVSTRRPGREVGNPQRSRSLPLQRRPPVSAKRWILRVSASHASRGLCAFKEEARAKGAWLREARERSPRPPPLRLGTPTWLRQLQSPTQEMRGVGGGMPLWDCPLAGRLGGCPVGHSDLPPDAKEGRGLACGAPPPPPIPAWSLRLPRRLLQDFFYTPENMAESQAGSGKVTLFCQEGPGGVTYRIPALLFLPHESVFLAFAEKRSSFKDEDAEFLVMRRGRKEGTSVQWGPQEPLTTAILSGHRTMNPCPVYEKKRCRVFLFFICVRTHVTEWQQIKSGRNAAKLCFVSSQDGGRTWSQLTDLTDQVIGEDLKNWATFAVGPGHGLQTSSGRLVIPAYTYYIHKRCFGHSLLCWTKPHCFIFYSDDLGQTWVQGQLLKNLRTTECQVAEISCQGESQVLYCSARSPDKRRAEAFSLDHGDRFEESFLCKELCEPPHGCQGSVVSFSPTLEPSETSQMKNTGESTHLLGIRFPSTSVETSRSWLVFSHPTNRCRRVNLGIYVNTSPLNKGCWKSPWMLYKGPCGYSDLAVCEEGRSLLFGCLFECGVSSECEEIAFQLFTDAELLRNVREECSCASSPSEEQEL